MFGKSTLRIFSFNAEMAAKNVTEPERVVQPVANDPWRQVLALPCHLRVEAPVVIFTVADLLSLGPGSIVRTSQKEGTHAPVQVNGQIIGRGEFGVANDTLTIRLTELL